MANVLRQVQQIEVLRMLIEGNSISSTSRLTGVHRDSCTRLMMRFAAACKKFLDTEMRDLELPHLEIDEMWTFCRKKDKNITGEEPDADRIGSFFLFLALDEKSRLIPAFRVDKRTHEATAAFIDDLRSRLKFPKPHASDAHAFKAGQYKPIVRISTDAFPGYPDAIATAFGPYAEYAQIKKDVSKEGMQIVKRILRGKIDPKAVTTSLVERTNLTTRTFMRRATRRTMGFSKKLANLRAAAAVHIAYYNYCWVLKTLKTTPAVKAGIASKKFSFPELYQHLRERHPDLFLVLPNQPI